MSQQNPTNAEIAAASGAIEFEDETPDIICNVTVDDPDFLATLNIDCLSCLVGALAEGKISQRQYDAIWQMFSDIEKQAPSSRDLWNQFS